MKSQPKAVRITQAFVVFATLSGLFAFNLGKSHADGSTALPGLTILKISDGTAPFDASTGAGNDTGPTDGIVRAGDVATFRFDSSLNDAASLAPTTYQHLTITTDSLPIGFRFSNTPVECSDSGTALVGDGITVASALTCDMGAKDTGTAWSVAVGVTSLNSVTDGTTATLSGTLTAQGVTAKAPASAPAIQATVATKIDVQLGSPWAAGAKLNNGQAGYVYIYSLGIKIKAGSEAPALPITLSNDASGLSQNAVVIGCGINGVRIAGLDWAYGFGMPSGKPGGLYGRFKGTTSNSVEDSGTITCTPRAGAAAVTDISIADVHSNPATYPFKTSDGLDINPADRWIVSDYIAVWLPANEFTAQNNFQLNGLNKLNEFAPIGASSHNANYGNAANEPGAGLTNVEAANAGVVGSENWYQSQVGRPNPGFLETYDLKFHDYFTGATMTGPTSDGVTFAEPVGTDYRSGDGVVATGVRYTALNDMFLKGVADLPAGFINCMTFDNRYTSITGLPGIETQGAYIWGNLPADQQAAAGWVLEYGIGGVDGTGSTWASTTDRKNGTCADNQSTNGAWFTSLADVPGGNTAVTKVRARSTDVYTAEEQLTEIEATHAGGVYSRLVVELMANGLTPGGAQAANYQKAYDPSGVWLQGWYLPAYNEDNGIGYQGDRVVAVGTRVRVKTGASTNVVTPLAPVAFSLIPTSDALGVSPAGDALNVTLTTTLPTGLSYLANSATCGTAVVQPTSCEPTVATNGHSITWNFGTFTAGLTMPTINFQVSKTASIPFVDGTLFTISNTISATNDGSSVEARTSSNTLTASNPGALAVTATATAATVDVGSPVTFNLKVQNVSKGVLGRTDFIDWLPYNGDVRLPTTTNNGVASLQSISQTTGSAHDILYTSTNPSTLQLPGDLDPSTIRTAIKWCTTAQFGSTGCPTGITKVTGLRMNSKNPIAAQEIDTFVFTMSQVAGSTDVNNDRFTNRFRGRAQGLYAVVESNNATTTIAAAQISSEVWNDDNQDGQHNTNEHGIEHARVDLIGTNGTVLVSTTTDSNGHYSLKNLPHGSYRVKVSGPTGGTYSYAPRNHTSHHEGESDTDPTTGETEVINVGSGTTYSGGHNAGLIAYTPSVSVVYSVNGNDANSAPGAAAHGGTQMTLTFVVTNTGNISLRNAKLITEKIPTSKISCPKTTLAVGESMTCIAHRYAPKHGAVFHDVATIKATPTNATSGLAASKVRDTDGIYVHRSGDGQGEAHENDNHSADVHADHENDNDDDEKQLDVDNHSDDDEDDNGCHTNNGNHNGDDNNSEHGNNGNNCNNNGNNGNGH